MMNDARVVEDQLGPRLRVRRIERQVRRARLPDPEHGRDEVLGARHADADERARGHAAPAEVGGDALGAGGEPAVRARAATAIRDDRDPLRRARAADRTASSMRRSGRAGAVLASVLARPA